MAPNILVLGGTSFVGLVLVRRLLDLGANVTIATRGFNRDPFGARVKRRKLERRDLTGLRKLARSRAWDVVYDQIGYSAEDAAAASDAFQGRVGRYVFTSSVVVYEPAGNRVEGDFDPCEHATTAHAEWSALAEPRRYAEGKRNAEAVLFREGRFPVVAVRFPNILGANDPSRRLDWHIDFVRRRAPIFVPDRKVRQSLIWSEDAARFLVWMGFHSHCGPINAASNGSISIGEFVELVAERLQNPAAHTTTRTAENHSPFGFQSDFTINVDLAESLGFQFTSLHQWLPHLIDEQLANGPRRSRDPALHAILQKLHGREPLNAEELKLLSRRYSELKRLAHRAERRG